MPPIRPSAIVLSVLSCGWSSSTYAAHPNALWRVVHGLCVNDKRVSGSPAPCMAVNLAEGWAVVSDPRRSTQVLLVPTARISGIESPRLLSPWSPNYWQYAWDARRFFEKRLGRDVPRDRVGMAINSAQGRSQDQLHIHIDCVSESVRLALRANQDELTSRWTRLSFNLAGHRYRARWIDGSDLEDEDPFKLIAERGADAPTDMSRQSLAVIPVDRWDGSPGFALLSAQSGDPGNPVAVAEELLDHRCDALKGAARPLSQPE